MKKKRKGFITYDCNICQHKATQKVNLSSHIKSVHFKERFPCEICDYQATKKSNLLFHVKNVHQKSENIVCTECNTSVQKISLTRHMNTKHSGEQPQYNCQICTFKTKHSCVVNRHMKTVHQKPL